MGRKLSWYCSLRKVPRGNGTQDVEDFSFEEELQCISTAVK